MKSFNKVDLAGELLEDMEILKSADGFEYAKLKLSTTNSGAKDSNGRLWNTVWLWNEDIINYFRFNLLKGNRLMIDAYIVYHLYTGNKGERINQGQMHATRIIDCGENETARKARIIFCVN